MLRMIALIIVMGLIGLAAYARVVQIGPDTYHVDPETAPVPGFPGHALLRPGGGGEAPVYLMPAEKLAAAVDAAIMAEPRTTRLAGSLDDSFASYVIRSKLFGFPDILSVKVIDLGDGKSTLALFSRLRIGQMDFGVNETRVRALLSRLSDS